MPNRRLYYRVVLKSMFAIGVFVLLLVFLSSLFVGGEQELETRSAIVVLDISDMQKGEIRKTRWDDKEVAVLHRNDSISIKNNNLPKSPSEISNTLFRSQKADYFVYYNHGDSGNCPLFYSANSFKDVCSSKLFDSTGREVKNSEQGYKIKIPPHFFIDNNLYFGSWNRE